MKRYNRKDFEEIGYLESGTSAAFIGLNKVTKKKGIYKENGCMIGVANEDVREKLASDILQKIGVPCAQIDLVYDETLNQNACFSNYILDEDEIIVDLKDHNSIYANKDVVENFVANYMVSVNEHTKDKKFLKQCEKNIYEYIYMSCMLDSYDLKTDNIPIMKNLNKNCFKVCPWFDFGVAFQEDSFQKKGMFLEHSSDEILNILYQNHFEKISGISEKVNEKLDEQTVEELFGQEYVAEAFSVDTLEQIKNRFSSQLRKSNLLREKRKDEKEKDTFFGELGQAFF